MLIGVFHLLNQAVRCFTARVSADLAGHVQRISHLNPLAEKVCVGPVSE